MLEEEFWALVSSVDLDQLSTVADLQDAICNFGIANLKIEEVRAHCGGDSRLENALIGAWAICCFYDLGRNWPEQVYPNRPLREDELEAVILGLLEALHCCHVEVPMDVNGDEVDSHYSAGRVLYQICGRDLEALLMCELTSRPDASMVWALGHLVSDQFQGYLQPATVELLIAIARNNYYGLGEVARETVVEDVVRINEWRRFYDGEIKV